MTTVINHRSADRQQPEREGRYVYIGRPSKWGNPFSHIPTARYATARVATVEEAVSCFRQYWYAPEQAALRAAALVELKDKVLGCFGCNPCHGHVIAEFVNGEGATESPLR